MNDELDTLTLPQLHLVSHQTFDQSVQRETVDTHRDGYTHDHPRKSRCALPQYDSVKAEVEPLRRRRVEISVHGCLSSYSPSFANCTQRATLSPIVVAVVLLLMLRFFLSFCSFKGSPSHSRRCTTSSSLFPHPPHRISSPHQQSRGEKGAV